MRDWEFTKLLRVALLVAAVSIVMARETSAQTIIYVNAGAQGSNTGSSWANAHKDLQAALAEAAAQPENQRTVQIWVAAGTYRPALPGGSRFATFQLLNRVAVYGGFNGTEATLSARNPALNTCVLSGDLNANDTSNFQDGFHSDNVRHVVSVTGADATAVLDGFVIAGGFASPGADEPDGHGGGLFAAVGGTGAVIRRCLFRHNYAYQGAAVSLAAPTTVVIENCRFEDNEAADIVAGVRIHHNVLSPGTTAYLRGCVFTRNKAPRYGAAIQIEHQLLKVVNCTLTANIGTTHSEGQDEGGSIELDNAGSLELVNSVIWNEPGLHAIGKYSSGTLSIDYCVLQGGAAAVFGGGTLGSHTISVDPLLTATQALSLGSPCIDSGSNGAIPATFVMDGAANYRVVDGDGVGGAVVDMGALEFASQAFRPVLFVRSTPGGLSTGQSWADAFVGSQGLQSALSVFASAYPLYEQIWVARGTYTPGPPPPPGASQSQIDAARAATFSLPNGLAIYGGFQGNESLLSQRPALPANAADAMDPAKATVLSGDLTADDQGDINRGDNAYHVATADSNATAFRIDGLTIAAGYSNGAGALDSRGAALLAAGGSGTISGCCFVGNQATDGAGPYGLGGAIFFESVGKTLRLESCLLSGNKADRAGVVYVGGGTLEVRRSSVRSNSDLGIAGVVAVDPGGTLNLVQSSFVQNTSINGLGVAFLANNTTLNVVNCELLGNTAGESCAGIGLNPGSTGRILGSIFVRNRGLNNSGSIGALDIDSANFTLTNTAFLGNESPANSTTVRFRGPSSVFVAKNCIWWQNSAGTEQSQRANLNVTDGTPVTLRYCTMNGWTGSFGDIAPATNNALDPQFLRAPSPGPDGLWYTPDDDYGDLRVAATSPAIDSGDALAVPADIYDIDSDGNTTEALPLDIAGNPRFYDDLSRSNTGSGSPPVDRGAYESNLAISTWLGAAGSSGNGVWGTAANWSGGVPTSTVRAVLDSALPPPLSYSITVTGAASAYSLTHSANQATLNLTGGNVTLSGPAQDQTAPLNVTGLPAADPRLTVRNTGVGLRTLFAPAADVGRTIGSTGRLTVTGTRITLDVSTTTTVGLAGTGVLTVQQQGAMGTGSLVLGSAAGSSGQATITDANSVLALGGAGTSLVIGAAGSGSVTVTNGGTFGMANFADLTVIGQSAGSAGALTISGAGSAAVISGTQLVVGDYGSANLTVSGGANLFTDTLGGVILARRPGSVANITIGAGSSWTESTSAITVGGATGSGQANITLAPGAQLIAPVGTTILTTGTLSGSGTVESPVFNLGTIRPGQSPGTLTINGSYRQIGSTQGGPAVSGTLVMEVAGDVPGTQYDRLIVNGQAEIAGGLEVRFLNGYAPGTTSSLQLVNTASVVGQGTFDVAVLPALSDGRFLLVDYGAARGPGHGLTVTLASAPLGEGAQIGDPQNAQVTGSPTGAVVADFNGDGAEDLALSVPAANATGAPGSVVVLLSAGSDSNGQWLGFAGQQQITVGVEPRGLASADFNLDGRADLAVANATGNSVSVMINSGTGTVFPAVQTLGSVGSRPVAVAATNLNVDAIDGESAPELIVLAQNSAEVRVFTPSAGAGAFAQVGAPVGLPPGSAPGSLTPFDPDQDKNVRRRRIAVTLGGIDAAQVIDNVGAPGGAVALAARTPVPVGDGPTEVVAANLRPGIRPNVDGRDLVIRNSDGTLSVLLDATVGHTQPVSLRPAVSITVGEPIRAITATDLELDGDADLAVLTGSAGGTTTVRLLRNDYLTRDPAGLVQQSNAQPVFATGVGGLPADGGAKLLVSGRLSGVLSNPDDLATIADSPGPGRGPASNNVVGFPIRLPSRACNRADVSELGGTAEAPGSPDGQLTVDDFIVYFNTFSDALGCPGANAPSGPACNRADITDIGDTGAGPDGQLTVDDVIGFINAFSDGC